MRYPHPQMRPFSLRFYAVIAIIFWLACEATDAMACKDSMAFTQDKQKHFAVSTVLGASARAVTADPAKAFALGIAPGVAKELVDMTGRGCASWNDMAWNAAGVGLGLYTTNWIIGPGKVIFFSEF